MHNEAAHVEAFVASLLPQLDEIDFPHEVLFGLDGCTDDTLQRLRAAIAGRPFRVVVHGVRRGKAAMLNDLMAMARGRVAVFTDGDVCWGSGALAALIARYGEGSGFRLSAARPIPRLSGPPMLQRVQRLAFDAWDSVRATDGARGELWAVSGQLYAVSRALIGPIPASQVNDDAHLGLRARHSGAIVEYVRDAVVTAAVPSTWRDFFLQKVRTRVGWRQLELEHGGLVRSLRADLRRATWRIGRQRGSILDAVLVLLLDSMCRVIASSRHALFGAGGSIAWRRIGAAGR
jgi:cellulose synthase/poly-beta-1,6-N-acetylglucosamine synthase-like glycosyltransferase